MEGEQLSFTYSNLANILSEFLERGVLFSLVQSLVEHPERFTGPFRPSTQVEKLLQHILQSREILFGDAIEEVFAAVLEASGYWRQNRILWGELGNGKRRKLECDLLFMTPDKERVLLVEQKLRDDHDSTKRRGQISNFREKVGFIRQNYQEPHCALMHFVDPALRKNKTFYSNELHNMSAEGGVHNTPLYGAELFEHLKNLGYPVVISWQDFEGWLGR